MTQQLMFKSKTAGYWMVESANQLLYSTNVSNAVWFTSNLTLTSGQTDPVAGTNAFTATATAANATINQLVTLKDGALNRVFSINLKRITGTGDISITLNGTAYTVTVITGAWVRYDISVPASGQIAPGIKIATSGDEVDVAFAQLEDGDTPTTYSVTTDTRYTVTQITDGDYPVNTARGCVFMDGYFFVITQKGEIYQSALEDASTWSALEFIQSQNDPSDGVYIGKQGAYIVAFKKWGIEFFYNAANPTGSVLAPVQNMNINIGCASEASVQDVGGALMFVGQTRLGAGRAVFVLSGGNPQKVSTPDIDKIVSADDMSTVASWTASVGSHLIYGLVLPNSNVTLVYDASSQLWSFFTVLTATVTTGEVTSITAAGIITSANHLFQVGDIVKISGVRYDIDSWYAVTDTTTNTFTIGYSGDVAAVSVGLATKYEETYFPIVASVNCAGKQYMQDISSGDLYEFSQNIHRDHTTNIPTRAVTGKFDADSARRKTLGQIEVIGDKVDATGYIRWSDDDFVSSSNFKPVDLELNRSRIRRTGSFSQRSFELLHLSDQQVRVESLEI